jgi:hypothetical protein
MTEKDAVSIGFHTVIQKLGGVPSGVRERPIAQKI